MYSSSPANQMEMDNEGLTLLTGIDSLPNGSRILSRYVPGSIRTPFSR